MKVRRKDLHATSVNFVVETASHETGKVGPNMATDTLVETGRTAHYVDSTKIANVSALSLKSP